MKRATLAALAALMLIPALAASAWATELQLNCRSVVYFSPEEGKKTLALQIAETDAAQHSIHVMAYSFTEGPLIDALIRARARGVDVAVVLDKGQDSPRYAKLRKGLPVMFDNRHAIQHKKEIMWDGRVVFLGSYNLTLGARKRNAENANFFYCPNMVELYLRNWEVHHQHALHPRQKKAEKRVKAVIGGGR